MRYLKSIVMVCLMGMQCHQAHCASDVYKNYGDRLEVTVSDGNLTLTPMDDNAIRVRFSYASPEMPEWVYINEKDVKYDVSETGDKIIMKLPRIKAVVDKNTGRIDYYSADGKLILSESVRNLTASDVQGVPTYIATQAYESPDDESLFGLGQFQDGILDVKGLERRLTQVNTQISVPMIVSNKGYGVLWNNYGMTEFNPSTECVKLVKTAAVGNKEAVNVTSTEGGAVEIRESNEFSGKLSVPEAGSYSIMLDVGQSMARKHDLSIGDKKVFSISNVWLPPTTSGIVYLEKGEYPVRAKLEKNDTPRVFIRKVDNTTTFRSPVSECVDYTVMAGSPDEVISSYRDLTGKVPLMPEWALGYIHCRERFHNQDELLSTAARFRKEHAPVDIMVQDWQYWGKYGWNAMTFDESNYPSPKEMTDSLHAMDLRLMVSMWSKIDPASEVGKQMQEKGYFIPGTSWVDFFNPEAADFYWDNFSNRLLLPYGIDAWWQDATEPENDDLRGRKIAGGSIPGEMYRNTFPLLVNKTVYEGSRKDMPEKRTMILTRSAFPGMQRYATATWSGDVGWDWDAYRRQIVAGLGMSVTGQPWWTYDAGGFFRPGNQYESKDYHELMMRWIQTSVFLPMMRVHGYMTDTEYWKYGDKVSELVKKALALRYSLLPYIYSENAGVSFDNATILRPLVMDFSNDSTALKLKYEYMFGPSLLVCPVVEPGIKKMKVYLPHVEGEWYSFASSLPVGTSGWIEENISEDAIPVYARAGSIIPLATDSPESAREALTAPLKIIIYPGADGKFTLYCDDGVTYDYEKGEYSRINLAWDDSLSVLTISAMDGKYEGMPKYRDIEIVKMSQNGDGQDIQRIKYKGKKTKVRFKN